MGYNGPMDMFDDYLASTPSDANKYSNITAKLAERMAKGGMVKKRRYAIGGVVDDIGIGSLEQEQLDRINAGGGGVGALTTGTAALTTQSVAPLSTSAVGAITGGATTGVTDWDAYYRQNPGTAPTTPEMAAAQKRVLAQSAAGTTGTTALTTQTVSPLTTSAVGAINPDQAYIDMYRQVTGRDPDTEGLAYWKSKFGDTIDNNELIQFTKTAQDIINASRRTVTTSTTGAPVMGAAPSYTAAQTTTTGQGGTATQQGATTTALANQITAASQAATPATVTADQITASTSTQDVKDYLKNLTAAQGTVSDKAQVTAAQQVPSTTAVSGMTGAKGTAATVVAPQERKLVTGETVSGTAVDMAEVETELAKLKAEQGTVTDESTTTGQLNKLMKNFDAGNPPPWAAASMRTAMATLAARGLGASSLAGQAIVQAALEAATPIATSDAAVYQKMNEQNLSNREAVAVLIGEQRAKFLGQAYDQNYDAKVKNAAKISDIANKNFDANVTIALENSRLANSMNIAQLSADNAVALAKIAQVATLETTNLNNRQQAAVENAKAFLAMDLKNLDNTQQTKMIVAQKVVDSIVSDTALAQAAKATNATNKLDADKISAQLALTASTFNAGEKNRIAIANSATANDIAKFNAQEANNRDQFNSKMASEVSVANAKILADISTANTAATNAAAAVSAKNATDLASVEYAQESQTFRDKLELSWKSGENMMDRATNIATATITGNASATAANINASAAASTAIGNLAGTIFLDWLKK
jgi:hypothetical protein